MKIELDTKKLRERCLADTKSFFEPDEPYRFIDNGGVVLAVAHCDTVEHKRTFQDVTLNGKRVVFSPALDDRLGVYTIMDVLPSLGLKFDILLTNYEEQGRTTASMFALDNKKKYNWCFEFDRRGTGAVFYQYGDTELAKVSRRFFPTELGSFSDISELDSLGCGCINVGTGYHDEHTYLCHAIVDDWRHQVGRFVSMFREFENTFFNYTPGSGRRYNDWWDRGYSYGSATKSIPPPPPPKKERKPKDQSMILANLEYEFDLYDNNRWYLYALDERTVKFCSVCGDNAVLYHMEPNGVEYYCENCDDERWWNSKVSDADG